jgi:nitroreductase
MAKFSSFIELAEHRFSVRKFSDKPIEKEKMDRVLRAGQVAPTAVNSQPQKIFILQSKEALDKAKRVTRFTFDAPAIILMCSDRNRAHTMQDGQYMGTVDCTIVLTQMMLAAEDEGLGTCWVRGYDINVAKKEFGLPDNLVPEALMPIGYPADDCVPGRMHAERLPIEDTVSFI